MKLPFVITSSFEYTNSQNLANMFYQEQMYNLVLISES